MKKCCVKFLVFVQLTSTAIAAEVFRFGPRDLFSNPDYTSYTNCGRNACGKFEAQCMEDGNCCLCRCRPDFSTYNVSEARCVSDETLLSESSFRFVWNDKQQGNVPMRRLKKPKSLGEINTIEGTLQLKKCQVVMNSSNYWSDSGSGDWKPLSYTSINGQFAVQSKKGKIILQWRYPDSAQDSWFHGLVIRLSIRCSQINSTLIFKTGREYNEKGFAGCFTQDTKSSFQKTFTCSKMTPTLCKSHCLGLGHSVAIVKQGQECSCMENTQLNFLSQSKFSCSIPCSGDVLKFCGGENSYSAYRTMPEWPHDFKFSSNGAMERTKYRCAAIGNPNPSTVWGRTFFCAKKVGKVVRISWFSRRRKRILARRKCIEINQEQGGNSSSWYNNFLCVPKRTSLTFTWSYTGPIIGMQCLQLQAEESKGWENNYICADRPQQNETEVSILCQDLTETSTAKPTDAVVKHSKILPHPPHSRSSPSSFIAISKVPGLGPTGKGRQSNDKNTLTLYVLVAFACILSTAAVTAFTIIHLKKRTKSKSQTRKSNVLQILDFDNFGQQRDKAPSHNTPAEMKFKRKSRTDELPPLPDMTTGAHFPPGFTIPLDPSNSTQDNSPDNWESSKTENFYESPKTLRAEYNKEKDEITEKYSDNNVNNSLGEQNAAYESVDDFVNRESMYIEVLP